MSVNPAAANAAASAAANNNAAVEAMITAELNALAADAQALQGQVQPGQVVQAQVLPSNGMTDLIQILGNRVAAALPPGLTPGDTFTAQVTGFNGTQILLQVLSAPEPGTLVEAPPPGLATATLADAAPPTALQAAATMPVLPEGVSQSLAPPPAVFVAASVRPAPGTEPGAPAPVTVQPPPPSQVIPQPLLTGLADIEARLAAARAGQVTVNVPSAPPPLIPSAPAPANPAPAGSLPAPPPAAPPAAATSPAAVQPPPPGAAGRFTFAPPITPSPRFSAPAPPATADEPAPAAAPPAAPAASFRDPVALVRALNLPNTPTNVAAARLAIDTPQRLPAALSTLESALPQSDDPRITTLRTLLAFVGKLEPSSPQLAAQISAFVDNVVTGNEAKLAQMLSAQLAADEPAGAPAAAAQPEAAPAPGALPPAVAEAALPVLALAQAAERGAALTVDLKTQLLAIVNAPPVTEENSDLVPAASTALTAITAVQLNAAQALNLTPQQMQFTLPMWLGNGYAQARIAIDRDAPQQEKNRNLDGDNFHIAFILDTKNLGTVSVDLQTVGRAFSLAVKTENENTAQRFADSLTRLTGRLESLRYRVNSAEASVAPRGTAAAAAGAATQPDAVAGDGEGDGVAPGVNLRA